MEPDMNRTMVGLSLDGIGLTNTMNDMIYDFTPPQAGFCGIYGWRTASLGSTLIQGLAET
jgi:hypothetical protein